MPQPNIPYPGLTELSKRALQFLRDRADEVARTFVGQTKPEILANKINPRIRMRDSYGRRLESGEPGHVISWSNSGRDWAPSWDSDAITLGGRAQTVESMKAQPPPVLGGASGDQMLDYHARDLADGNKYVREKLKALFMGSRTLDANQVFVPKSDVPTLSELREVLPYLEQLPLYSGGPLGGSTEAKLLRKKMLDRMLLEDRLPE